MSRILVVEDEQHLADGLRYNLEAERHDVVLVDNGEEALARFASEHVDLVVLDVMLPKITGLDICKKLRGDGNAVPIIMLTARGQEIDKVLGLKLGADAVFLKSQTQEFMAYCSELGGFATATAS